jgi:soluble lytic murein transglycosylase
MVRTLSSALLIVLAVSGVVPQPRNEAARAGREDEHGDVIFPGDEGLRPGGAIARLHSESGKDTGLTEPSILRASRIARKSGNLLLERFYLEQLRRRRPLSPQISTAATLRLAENAVERGHPASAIRLLGTSAPGSDASAVREAQLVLGRAYLEVNQPEDARRTFTAIVEADRSEAPDDSSYAAARALDELGGDSPIAPADHRRRAEIYQFHRDLVPARRHFEAWAAGEPASEPAALLSIGRGYALAGEHAEAVKLYERLLERQPSSPEAKDALLRLAGAYSRTGKAKEALARYQSFIERYPGDEMLDRAYLNQVDMLRDEGDVTSALKWCERTVTAFRGRPPEAVALFAKARIHLTRDEWKDALDALDTLSTLGHHGGTSIPGGTSIHEIAFLRALALEKLVRFPEAVEALLSVPDGRNEYYGALATERLRRLAAATGSAKAVSEKSESLTAALGAKDREVRRAAAIGLLRLFAAGDKHEKALSVLRESQSREALNIKAGSVKRPAVDALVSAGAYADAANLLASGPPVAADAELMIKGDRADKALQALELIWNKVPADTPLETLPRERLRHLYPLVFAGHILRSAKKDGIDPRLILSIMRQESRFDPAARSNAGARGLMQFISPTAREVERQVEIPGFELNDLYDPEIAIMFGSRHLADLFRKFPGQTEAVVAAYNAGADNMSRWLARSRSNDPERYVPEIMFTQTKDYVYRVMANLRMYQELYDEELRPIDEIPAK